MEHYRITKYYAENYAEWNTFVSKAKNATFLFHRDFMDYHCDRFQDFSLLIYNDNKLVALLPANCIENVLYSHQGLTYGGFVLDASFNANNLSDLILELVTYLKSKNLKTMHIKMMPEFYGTNLLHKIKHQLVKNQAQTYRSDMVLAIDYSKPICIHKTKLKHYNRNLSAGFIIQETTQFSAFWNELLIPRLKNKHAAKPVHSLHEIESLKNKFPNQIKQFNIYQNNALLAGITIFDVGTVVKSQYGATSEKGEKLRAIEFLFIHLINLYKNAGKAYFSMGTVTEQNPLGYNPGLLKQKEELGCRLFLQDFLSLKLV